MRAPGGVATLARWAQSPPPLAPDARPPPHALPLFPYDDVINSRLALWHGDISTLDADVITNTTDETLMECNAVSERIMHNAGADLKEEIITRGHEVGVGAVVVTPGFSLRARHVAHVVCPRYVPAHRSAAEGALHACYRNVLFAASELGARSLALCVINTPRRNFPPDVAAHIALRTIRRHLEQQRAPQLVVLASACAADAALYAALAALYFPRSAREALGPRPLEAGGPQGEPLHPERRIRIIHNPHEHAAAAEDDTSLYDEDAAAEAAAAFARACAPDTQRLLAPARAPLASRTTLGDRDQ